MTTWDIRARYSRALHPATRARASRSRKDLYPTPEPVAPDDSVRGGRIVRTAQLSGAFRRDPRCRTPREFLLVESTDGRPDASRGDVDAAPADRRLGGRRLRR